jgi:hypothetical protein
MSMTTPQNKFEDPKIQLIFSIQKHDEKITWYLENGQYLNAGRSLHYLLNRVEINDEPADREMRELRDTIGIDTYHNLTESDFDIAYIILHKFLNRTYYKGFSNNRPPTRERSMKDLQIEVDIAKYEKSQQPEE